MKVLSKFKFMSGSSKVMVLTSFLGIYLLSTGVSLAVFSYLKTSPNIAQVDTNNLSGARNKISTNLPRTEECPINGGKFTEIEKSIWQSRRPLAAMIENHVDSRPQSG